MPTKAETEQSVKDLEAEIVDLRGQIATSDFHTRHDRFMTENRERILRELTEVWKEKYPGMGEEEARNLAEGAYQRHWDDAQTMLDLDRSDMGW